MKPPTWKRLALATLLEAAVLLALYGLVSWRAAATDVVARLFAAGSHVATGDLLLAVTFVGLRVAVVVGLPPFVAYRVVRVGWIAARTRPSDSP